MQLDVSPFCPKAGLVPYTRWDTSVKNAWDIAREYFQFKIGAQSALYIFSYIDSYIDSDQPIRKFVQFSPIMAQYFLLTELKSSIT